MKIEMKHDSDELIYRGKIALAKDELIEIVEHHTFPSGAQKAAVMLGCSSIECYSVWALAALRRDYPNQYESLEKIIEWRSNNPHSLKRQGIFNKRKGEEKMNKNATEAILCSAFLNSPIPMLVVSENFDIILENIAHMKLSSISAIGKKIYHPGDNGFAYYGEVNGSAKIRKEALIEVFDTGNEKSLTIEHKNRSTGAIQTLAIHMILACKNPKMALILSEDISEDKKNEEKYVDLLNLQSQLLASVPLAIIGIEGRLITFANDSVRTVFGWEPEELIGQSTRILYRDEDAYEAIGDTVYEELKTQPVFAMELLYPCRKKDGSEMLCNITASRLVDSKNYTKIVATYEDITEKKQHEDKLLKSLHSIILALSSALEARDPYTAGHQRRVADLANEIGEKLKIPANKITGLKMACLIHDIGKISIPADILSKPTKLSNVENLLIQIHPVKGYEILKEIDFPWPIAEIIVQHHERIDGSGYPLGIKGDKILLEAKILAVADVVEAMSSHRPYRAALGKDAALNEIKKNSGVLYDPEIVNVCLDIFEAGWTFGSILSS